MNYKTDFYDGKKSRGYSRPKFFKNDNLSTNPLAANVPFRFLTIFSTFQVDSKRSSANSV